MEFFIKICPGVLQHFGNNFCTFYSLEVEESQKVQALMNMQVGQFPPKIINVQAQIRPCRVE